MPSAPHDSFTSAGSSANRSVHLVGRAVICAGRCGLIALGLCALLFGVRDAAADNAGFALAPRGAMLAIDARDAAGLLAGGSADGVRPLLEAVAGREALQTFDVLAKRCNAASDTIAKEVFGGRVAFIMPAPDGAAEDAGPWLLGVESDDDRCERVLKFLGARMHSPDRFHAVAERLVLRRVGGWLLIAPSPSGDSLVEASAGRIAHEDPASSLLGDPLVQPLLGSDAPMRIFVRHDAATGGSSSIAIRPGAAAKGMRAELVGRYERLPFIDPGSRGELDPRVVRAFEPHAALALANPCKGVPSKSDSFWVELVPEMVPPPGMRVNLSGERLVAVGSCTQHLAPALAFAWRIEDPDQGRTDQDHFMKAVQCGMARALEGPHAPVGARSAATEPTEAPGSAPRRSALLGPFLDRFVGASMKLGGAELCWNTVATPCGGWHVYASDPEWLGQVSEVLSKNSCFEGPRPEAGGVGFCDGPRVATLLRRWRPLVGEAADPTAARLSRGIDAIAETIESLGLLRFEYLSGSAGEFRAAIDLEPKASPGTAASMRGSVAETPGRETGAQKPGSKAP